MKADEGHRVYSNLIFYVQGLAQSNWLPNAVVAWEQRELLKH